MEERRAGKGDAVAAWRGTAIGVSLVRRVGAAAMEDDALGPASAAVDVVVVASLSAPARLKRLAASACDAVFECTTLGLRPPAGLTGTVEVEDVLLSPGVNP